MSCLKELSKNTVPLNIDKHECTLSSLDAGKIQIKSITASAENLETAILGIKEKVCKMDYSPNKITDNDLSCKRISKEPKDPSRSASTSEKFSSPFDGT